LLIPGGVGIGENGGGQAGGGGGSTGAGPRRMSRRMQTCRA